MIVPVRYLTTFTGKHINQLNQTCQVDLNLTVDTVNNLTADAVNNLTADAVNNLTARGVSPGVIIKLIQAMKQQNSEMQNK